MTDRVFVSNVSGDSVTENAEPEVSRRRMATAVFGAALGAMALSGCEGPVGETEESVGSAGALLTGTGLTGTNSLSSATAVGATSVQLAVALPTALGVRRVWLAIGAYTTSCEVVQVTAVSGQVATVSPALSLSHSSGAVVAVLEQLVVTPQLFGALADGTSDDAPQIRRAYDALKLVGGELYFPAATYVCNSTISLDSNSYPITFRGNGGRWSQSIIVFRGGATASLFTLADAYHVTFQGLLVKYDQTNYTGFLVSMGHGTLGRDPGYIHFSDCTFQGTPAAKQAAALIRLNKAICCSLQRCNFAYAIVGILGQDLAPDLQGGYSNSHTIKDCVFNCCDGAAIRNPGESWTIVNCCFEPDSLSRASGIDHDPAVGYSYGLTVVGGWFGDVTVAGKNWITLKALGASLSGLRMGGTPNFACIKLLSGCQGIVVSGVRPEGTGIEFPSGANYVFGVSVVGCDFGGTPTPLVNPMNCKSLRVAGCSIGDLSNYGTHVMGGDTYVPADSFISFGYMSSLPANRHATYLASVWGNEARDALGQAFTTGTAVLGCATDSNAAEVVIAAGKDPVAAKPYAVAHFGVTGQQQPYAYLPVSVPSYTASTRPAPTAVRPQSIIWNLSTNKLNISDGSAWRDAMGTLV